MSFEFEIKSVAVLDIEQIVDYYKTVSPELANTFLDRLEEAKKYIIDYPIAFQIKYKNVRTLLLKQFPYQIHYIVDERKKQIVVIAIIHAYKNPKIFNR